MTWPVWVWPSSRSSRLARPKSVTLGVPSASNRTLAGLRSRWTIPARCATSTARASVATSSAAGRPGCGVPARRSARVPPSSSSRATIGGRAGRADVEDLDDVRVAEPGHRLGLDLEPGEMVGPADLDHHLEGDQAVQLPVACLVDHAHPAPAQPAQDLISVDPDRLGLALRRAPGVVAPIVLGRPGGVGPIVLRRARGVAPAPASVDFGPLGSAGARQSWIREVRARVECLQPPLADRAGLHVGQDVGHLGLFELLLQELHEA